MAVGRPCHSAMSSPARWARGVKSLSTRLFIGCQKSLETVAAVRSLWDRPETTVRTGIPVLGFDGQEISLGATVGKPEAACRDAAQTSHTLQAAAVEAVSRRSEFRADA